MNAASIVSIRVVSSSSSISRSPCHNRCRGTPTPKSAALADQLNSLIYELIQRCTKSLTEPPRPYFALSVIGYRTDDDGDPVVGSVLPGTTGQEDLAWTTELASARVGWSNDCGRRRRAGNGTSSRSGSNPSPPAVHRCARRSTVPDDWPDSGSNASRTAFPPIVINFSDGESTDGDPRVWARRLRGLHSADGSVLFFNLDLTSTQSSPVLFADRPDKGWSPFTSLMFEMSSELPDMMLAAARAHGFQVSEHARGFGSNADFRSVVSFLNVGTSIGRLMR